MAEPLSFNTMVHMVTIKLSAINVLLGKASSFLFFYDKAALVSLMVLFNNSLKP